jgi:hypothetical protein
VVSICNDVDVKIGKVMPGLRVALVSGLVKSTRNNDICPFNWIKDHLTHDKINKPGKHKLFTSNKIRIFIKNGEIHYQTNDAEFMTDIKFNPESNQFSL